MAKYYYEYNGQLEEVELAQGTVTNFRKSNPHLSVLTSSQVTAEQRSEIAKRIATAEAHAARAKEYPSIGDQLDAIMKWAFTETEIGLPAELVSLAAKCMSVKSKHPLP